MATLTAPGASHARFGLRRAFGQPAIQTAQPLPSEPRPHHVGRPVIQRYVPIATQRPQNIRTRSTGWHTYIARVDGQARGEHRPIAKTARPVLRRVPRPWYAGTEIS